jgi:hypothetical protein
MPTKGYHQLPRATGTAGPKAGAARTIAREVCASSAVLVSVLVCACSSKVQHPPELGNCQSEGDASCFPSPGGGSVAEPQRDAASDDATSSDDGGACGTAHTAHNSVATQNPQCVPCIIQSCCPADVACGQDPACLSLVSSAFPGSGTPMCPSQTAPASCQNFTDFAGCVANCPSCPTLTLRDF